MRTGRRAFIGAAIIAAAGAAISSPAMASSASSGSPSSASHRQVGLVQLAPKASWQTTQSNNWSGYNQGALEKGTTFSSISATWTVPTATQHKAGEAESSATWIGIGGGCLDTACTATDETLIQAGTGQDIAADGTKSYYAWYELIPVPSTTVSLPVAPGNKVSVSIKQTIPGVWSIAISNLSTGKSWSTTTPYPSTMGSAEWIEETPLLIGTGGTGISALPRLSTVNFSNATANGAPAGLTSSEGMQLVDSSGQVLATPSDPNSGKSGFNDCTYATTCSAP